MILKNKKHYYFALFGLFLGTIFLWQEVIRFSDKNLKVYFFDVGQGDAAYIRTPENQDILVDGGPDSTILTKLGKEMPFFDREIELVMLSHPQADHLSGLIDVMNRYKIDRILWTKIKCDTGVCQEFERKINEKKILEEKVVAGNAINLGSIEVRIFHPFSDLEDKYLKDSNESTIVAQIVYGKNSFLFTGDISKEIEDKLLNTKFVLKSDVLKVAHHGSKQSSSLNFLSVINPNYSIISVGAKNSYGHPTPQTLQNLKEINSNFFRTDKDGDIKCESDGQYTKCHKE